MVRARRVLAFYVLMFVLLLGMMEGGLAVLALAVPSVGRLLEVAPRPGVTKHLADPELGFRPNPEFPEHDRWGFRNTAVPERAQVVSLGDSQTYGAGVLPGEAWPAVLAETTGLTTYSMAFGGFGPTHSLLLCDRALELKPAVVVEAVYSGNDLFDCFEMVHVRNQLSRLASTEPALLASIRDAEQRDPLATRANALFEARPPGGGARAFLRDHSRLYSLARAIKHRTTDVKSLDAVRARAQASRGRELFFDSPGVPTVFTSRYRLCGLNLDDVRLAEGLQIALRALGEIREKCQAAGADLVLLLVPTKEYVYAELVQEQGVGDEDYRRLVEFEAVMWSEVTSYLEAAGISYVDARDPLRASLRDRVPPYDYTSNGHPNRAGQRVIAELVAAELSRRGLPD